MSKCASLPLSEHGVICILGAGMSPQVTYDPVYHPHRKPAN